MSYRMHCNSCDQHLTRGRAFLDILISDKNGAPVEHKQLCTPCVHNQGGEWVIALVRHEYHKALFEWRAA